MYSDILQYVGYAASTIIAVSMMMSSIIKFRWINLVGASTFAVYGFFIGAIPVGLLNMLIVAIDVYYIIKIYSKKEYFQTLEVRANNKYLLAFLDFYVKEIQKYFPGFTYKPEINTVSFMILRDAQVAGVFLAHKDEQGRLVVGLDFVTPEYRDYKTGEYIYVRLSPYFKEQSINTIVTKSNNKYHAKYLKKMGFSPVSDNIFEKQI